MKNFSERKKSWDGLYAEINKSLVFINYSSGDVNKKYVFPYAGKQRERIEYALAYHDMLEDQINWLDDDKLPFLNPYTGTEIFARAFGCEVYESGDNMPFALPLAFNAKDAAKIKKPDLNGSALIEIFDTADILRAARPGVLLALPDIQSPLDIAALIWSKEDFFAAMIEEPNAVKELVAMTESLLTEFLDAWFARYGTEFISHYPAYYMPFGVTLSEDEIGAISPEHFREFSLGSINALSDRYGGVGVHCCADSRHQWPNLRSINGLKMLNICQPYPVIGDAFKFFNDTCAQMPSPEIISPMLETPDYKLTGGAVLQWNADNKEEAVEMCKKLRELIHRSDSFS